MPAFLLILLKIAWALLCLISAFVTIFLFAFADSPESGKAAQKLFYPTVLLGLAAYCTGGYLLAHPGPWWHIPAAFGLVIAPPICVMLGYRWV